MVLSPFEMNIDCFQNVFHVFKHIWPISSVGQSVVLITRRSQVRDLHGPLTFFPILKLFFHKLLPTFFFFPILNLSLQIIFLNYFSTNCFQLLFSHFFKTFFFNFKSVLTNYILKLFFHKLFPTFFFFPILKMSLKIIF